LKKEKLNTNKVKLVLSKKDAELQKFYILQLEKFFSLVELSYALKKAPRIEQNK
jgi:hypothetical protein